MSSQLDQSGDHPKMISLGDESDFDLTSVVEPDFERWRELAHCAERRRFFILLAGESVRLPIFQVEADSTLLLSFMLGLPQVSLDGLTLDVSVLDGFEGNRFNLLTVPLKNDSAGVLPQRLSLSLSCFSDRQIIIEVACNAGPEGDPLGDWLALDQIVVGPERLLTLGCARSSAAWRMVNEAAHFAGIYDHKMYRTATVPHKANQVQWISLQDIASPPSQTSKGRTADVLLPGPEGGENANAYAHRVLGHLIRVTPPDFSERLRRLAGGAPVRMLSLCSGAARIEAQLIAASGVKVELTLVDTNRDLLEQAADQMPANADVRLIVADVNQLPLMPGRFDVAVCVSGLHHLVELESVLSGINVALRTGGEFWSVGEQVGRNGSRLWPDDYEIANELFRTLPEQFRRNLNTGAIDERLPNADCSAGCFEGIRSEELLSLLDRFFQRADVYVRNVFLWRFVDFAYVDNYRLDIADDLACLQRLVLAEHECWQSGGIPSELHGVFVRR